MTTTDQTRGAEVALATNSNALDPTRPTVAGFIKRLAPELGQALPKHMDAERLTRIALTLVRQSEVATQKEGKPENSLAACTPESFAGALLTAAALGLEPGVNAEAYLVPYKGECTLIVGYQGMAKLFWQHPLAKHLDAHAVHEKDQFDYAYGLAQYLRHKPAAGERGKITHYYAVAELSTGASRFVVLTADEVKALRGGKVGPSGRIPDPMHWMERKTAIRQLFKLLPKSSEIAAALAVDEQPGSVLRDNDVPTLLANGDILPALPPSVVDQHEQQAETDAAQRVTSADVFDEAPAALDACPACGVSPGHSPSECPMAAELDGSTDVEPQI
jgi:recombination protein RecT